MVEKCGWRRKDVWNLRSQANQHLEFERPGRSSQWNRRLRDSCVLKAKWRKYFKKERMWSTKSELYLISQSVQFLSRVPLFATLWTAAHQASLSITNSWSLLKLTSTESVMPSNHLIFCHPLFLLPPIHPSIRVFSNESALHIRWPKCWSFSFNISPSNEHAGLISFSVDWLDLLAVQGTLKSLLQHDSSKASILQHSAFFIV